MTHRTAVAITVAAVLLAPTAGCSALRAGGGEAVSAPDLQKDITDRLTQAGHPPKSVSCKGGLKAEAGASTRCDVVLGDTNSIEPVVTVTAVDPVTYSVAPAVSGEQLAAAVGRLLASPTVDCESGLDGKIGAQAQCEVTKDAVMMTRTVEVTNVEGLLMSYAVLPVLARQQVQDLLAERLQGGRPDTVDCAGDLQGKVGASLDCTTVTGGARQRLTLTVTGVKGDQIDFAVAPKG
jgi:hypothetical protein